MKRIFLALSIVFVSASLAAAQSQVKKDTVSGVTNFAQIETTVACAGAIKPEAVPDIKKMGFVSIINLREASEAGANVEAEEAAARAAGIKYAHIPFNNANPSTAAVDRFIQVISQPGQQPAFIHCAGGGRAAMMWFVKRVVVDKWDTDRAMAEAGQLGLANERSKAFALDYVKNKK
jgi:uncharacterized protein (TIGR01244 family)